MARGAPAPGSGLPGVRPVILFIHGFGSCGWGEKSLALRRYLGIERVLAPDLPFHPEAALDHLRDLVTRYRVQGLVGSSLGGFYATCLNATETLPGVLINPMVRPHELLADYLGPQARWCDAAPFQVTRDYLHSLARLQRRRLRPEEPYLVLLQQGDEVLDYRQAAAFYADKQVVQQAQGSHRFDGFATHLPQIAAWLASRAAIDPPSIPAH